MSLLPLKNKHESPVWYNGDIENDETELLVGIPSKPHTIPQEVGDIIANLFLDRNEAHEDHEHPKTHPNMRPIKRFTRHRNRYIYLLNEFRHWWKTSRLLVRVSGGAMLCNDATKWEEMASYIITLKRGKKLAFKSMKRIGQGGPEKPFLKTVKPVSDMKNLEKNAFMCSILTLCLDSSRALFESS